MNIKWLASLAFLIVFESSRTKSQDVRVKLCGREFIRMVVTACGSSRLKRNTPDSGPLHTKPHRSFQNWFSRDLLAYDKWTPTNEEEEWKEFDFPERVTEHPAPQQHISPPANVLVHSTTVQDLSMSSRTRRDVGPAGVCCTSGCMMSELIQYC